MKRKITYIGLAIFLIASPFSALAQKSKQKKDVLVPSLAPPLQKNEEDTTFSLKQQTSSTPDSIQLVELTQKRRHRRNWATWRPETKRAMWLALVLPGAGQIYNRKYWKLPIIYGGFVGCTYAISWNNQMYHDYSQAYMDIMDDDPSTQSYNQFLHLGNRIDNTNIDRYKEIFRKRKDRYRRWRDMGMFVMIGVYAFSVIDAYVDASLSEFDISDDLTLKIEPTIINNKSGENNPFKSSVLGLQCSITF